MRTSRILKSYELFEPFFIISQVDKAMKGKVERVKSHCKARQGRESGECASASARNVFVNIVMIM